MRTLTEHRVNPGNDTLTITVLDEPGLEATIKQRDELISRQQSASALPPAEREQKELMHSRKMATIYDDPKGIDAILAEREKTHH